MTITIQRPHQISPAPAPGPHGDVSPAMRYELQAETEAGRRLVSLAEELARAFATRAAEHDREASYPFEAIDALKARGYFSAPIPEEIGGLGVGSVRDVLIASSRLARGDASVAIGVNMHLVTVGNLARRYQMSAAAGNERRATIFGGLLRMLVQTGSIIAAGVSEPGQDLLRPSTTAERTEDGWVINGRKIFCTMSPAATIILVAVSARDPERGDQYSYAMVPANSPGVTYHDDWDALGMRASGSQSISFENVRVPEGAIRGGFPAGEAFGMMERNLTSGAFHASASLGIAEAAHDLVVAGAAARRKNGRESATNTILASHNAIDLAAMRAIFDRAGRIIDQYYRAHPADEGTPDEMAAAFAEIQSAKAFINEASVRVVDRALTLSGGAGFMNKHPLSRAYRDVRAGAFMHPLGANRAYEFIGQVALGLEPALS
jgi:alkylation response protein AidB-like acyl-CoA dehydrogenase